jgi:MFS family permease
VSKPFFACFVVKNNSVPNDASPRLDLAGIPVYVIGLTLFLYGLSSLVDSRFGVWLAIAGVIGLVLFGFIELKAANPLIDIRIFRRNKNFALSNVAAMFNYAATFAVSYLMSIYLQEVKGMTAGAAGLFMVTQPLLQAIISPLSGRMADKHSPFILASLGMAVCTGALVCFAFFGIGTSLLFVLFSLLLTGVGFGLFSSPNQTAIMSSVGPGDLSMASSLIATSRNIGQNVCMAIITIVMGLRLGGQTLAEASKPEIVGCFRVLFIIFACVCAVGVFISLQRKGKNEK